MAILFIMFVLGLVFVLYLFSSFFIGNKQTVEEPITGKISDKGFYFSPSYQVITEDHGLSYVTKSQFYDVDRGDTITGYQTNNLPFFTTLDIVYDGAVLIVIILVLGVLVFSFAYYFYRKFFSKKLEGDNFTFNQSKKRSKKVVDYALILYVIMTIMFLFLVFSNLLHQIVPFGQTKVEANIIDEEIEKGYGRYITDDHYFFIAYSDMDDQEYLVRKQVNYHTYNTYKNDYGIPIHYPNNNPANAFIQVQSVEDISYALMSFQTLLILSILYSYSRIYKRYKKNKADTK